MRIRYNPEARPELAAWEYYIDEPEKLRGHWAEQFARRQPMVLELGCGKGGFLAQMAPAHPEKNYIALDVKSEMLVLAKRKAEEAYAAAGVPMDNFLMTAVDIERIFLIMDETDQFDEVYINFCPPCPKCRQHKHMASLNNMRQHNAAAKGFGNFCTQQCPAKVQQCRCPHRKTGRDHLGRNHGGNGIGAVVRAVGEVEHQGHQHYERQQHGDIKHFSAPLLRWFRPGH